MNVDLDPSTSAARGRAVACARDVVAPAAFDIDRTGRMPAPVLQAACDAVPADVTGDGVTWVVCLEELATKSAATALAAAGAALGLEAGAGSETRWTGLRGIDVDSSRAAGASEARWELAVSAVLIGLSRGALEEVRAALRAAREAGRPDDAAHGPLADAATMVDGARLLLWQAARATAGAAPAAVARGMARLHALDALALALTATELAMDAEAFRPGTTLDRVGRDAATARRVFGDHAAQVAAVAAGVLPG